MTVQVWGTRGTIKMKEALEALASGSSRCGGLPPSNLCHTGFRCWQGISDISSRFSTCCCTGGGYLGLKSILMLADEEPFISFLPVVNREPEWRNEAFEAAECIEAYAVLTRLAKCLEFRYRIAARARKGITRNVHPLNEIPAHVLARLADGRRSP